MDPHRPPSTGPSGTLEDRYELLQLVGAGGVAEVWRARDHRLGRDVAVKLLSGPAARDPEHRTRVEREARALARISHSGVVAVFDYGEQPSLSGDPVPFIVMELVEGPDLARHLAVHGALDVQEAVELVRAALEGVSQAHEIGIVHGDLKPANVLLAPEGPKVTDFGVARILAEETGHTSTSATPAYAAPEILRGERPTEASDVYSAACVAFEALTGRAPYAGDNIYEITQRHLYDPVPSPAALRPDVPDWLDAVVRRGLAKDPEDRFPSAAAFAAALGGRAAAPVAVAGTAVPSAATVPVHRPATELLPQRSRTSPLRAAGRRLRRIPVGPALAVLALLLLVPMEQAATATVRVPELVGLSLAEATALAEASRFEVAATEVEGGGAAGTVLAQSPEPGTLLRRGRTIALQVSKGKPQVAIPDVRGKPLAQATAELRAAGLEPRQEIFREDGDTAPGTVFMTEPAIGTTVDEGTPVDVYVTTPPPPPPAEDDRGPDDEDRKEREEERKERREGGRRGRD